MSDLTKTDNFDMKSFDEMIDNDIKDSRTKVNNVFEEYFGEELDFEKNEIYEKIIYRDFLSYIVQQNPENYQEVINQCLLYAINKFRVKEWLEKLELNESLNRSAKSHASYLASNNTTWHANRVYGEFERSERIGNFLKYEKEKIVATWENNAYTVENVTIQSIIDSWANSKWHYATLISKSDYLGVGYYKNPKTWYGVLVIQTAKKN